MNPFGHGKPAQQKTEDVNKTLKNEGPISKYSNNTGGSGCYKYGHKVIIYGNISGRVGQY
ncbi:hypothetical protein SCALIN_C47_0036 [Candidatus Scalindua japonica]|uniref:Uncharacterized protein n=1 Tax=Candidatus Scalindua japonica TaxID=1284222 RepID=A0A286U4L6_9BACT|nr:hypothetical protein SCALIN_C47_0036 [Candidatus Scalindua japonica]